MQNAADKQLLVAVIGQQHFAITLEYFKAD